MTAVNSSPLLIRPKAARRGEILAVAPDGKDWRYIDFRVVQLGFGETLRRETTTAEVALVVITGSIDVTTSAGAWKEVGRRGSPFDGPPMAVYLPPGVDYEISAVTASEIAICAAPGDGNHAARLIAPGPENERVRGDGQAKRLIRDIIMKDSDAHSLFLTEVVTLPGNWSSYPPHKHDTDNLPHESQLEELYFYHAKPADGFAFQRVYTMDEDLDETITVHDGDVVLVPRGYHVCAAAAEYWIYYLNVLAGPKHVYRMTFDPRHAWIKENWSW